MLCNFQLQYIKIKSIITSFIVTRAKVLALSEKPLLPAFWGLAFASLTEYMADFVADKRM